MLCRFRKYSREMMLVIHWAKHNKSSTILKSGIRPTSRKLISGGTNLRGVYVYPFSRNKTLSANWKRNLKVWDRKLGNYNGFIFKLSDTDFPLYAGYWFFNRANDDEATIKNKDELRLKYGEFFSGEIVNLVENGISYNWADFEIIIPHRITPSRIIKILKDRE